MITFPAFFSAEANKQRCMTLLFSCWETMAINADIHLLFLTLCSFSSHIRTLTDLFLLALPMTLFSAQRLRKHPSMMNLRTFQKHLISCLLVWSRTSVLCVSFEMRNHNLSYSLVDISDEKPDVCVSLAEVVKGFCFTQS